ncbi:hypothetical protein [Shewanella donghaensis]|uniref:hypothetical protein n=1 Tax=Shewanella donghaensis TaxID=238836 RepID=UPI001183CE9F|nr:hypothetical protein [Shewanella donghaensis]
MKNKFKLSVLCIAVLGLTACSDDDTDTSGLETQIKQLEEQNAELNTTNETLSSTNESLVADNASLVTQTDKLQEKAVSYISTFSAQCAEEGAIFDYIDPNAPAEETPQVATFASAMASEDCMSCHNYEGSDPANVPHGDYGVCSNCHESPHDETPPVDPGNPQEPTFPQPEGDDSKVDGKTGASGAFYYNAGSFLNADYLAQRLNGSIYNYEWKEVSDGSGAKTLKTACGLQNREYMADMFPADGKEYQLSAISNQMGAKLVSTVNKFTDDETAEEVETPNIAIFGYGMKLEDDGNYYVSMSIGKNNTCYNVINDGEARLSYYEYSPMLSAKFERNMGARILGTVDFTRTALKKSDWVTEVPGLGAGETFTPSDVDWTAVGACSLVIKVDGIIPLG